MKKSITNKISISDKIRDISLSQYHSGNSDGIIDFIFDTLPTGVLIMNRKMEVVYGNKQASLFLSRFDIPEEIPSVGRRVFDALDRDKFQELFPGEIIIVKKFEGSPSNWLFRLVIPVESQPIIVIYIIEDKISNKLNVNEIRQQYRLTRREADIVRRLLDGLKNAEISKELEIVEQTVKDHLSNIYQKMGVENRFDLIRSMVSPSHFQPHI
jgi:DNA-binding CsgD family transcriptional regulator